MTSSSVIPSSALSHKASSTHHPSHRNHQPVRSPSDRQSSLSKSKSPTPETVTTSPPSLRGLNGDSNSRNSNGQDESEAETDILSEGEKSKPKAKNRAVNHEHRDDDNHRSSPSLSTRLEPRRKHAASTASSVNGDATDKRERKTNGTDKRENGHGKGTMKEKLRLPTDGGSATSRAQSADPSISPPGQNDRDRQARSAEPRKRKFSDSQRPSKLEPPRQKPRLDGTNKSTTKTNQKTRRPSSPPTPAPPTPGIRAHKRAASMQSNLPAAAAPAAYPRKKRESSVNTNPSDPWNSDSSSEGDSPRRPPVPRLAPPPRSSRSSRAQTSPTRVIPVGSKRADRYGMTPLLKACERGNFEAVQQAYEEAPAELDQTDNGGFAPLQKAALGGHSNIVQFLLDKGCRKDCTSNADHDSPLIDAVDNGHVDVVKILLTGGVNPHHANNQGKRAIDAVEDADATEEEKTEMKTLIEKAMHDFEGSDSDDEDDGLDHFVPPKDDTRSDLLYIEPNRQNLLEYSRKGDVVAVGQFIESVKPNNACAVVAARGGHHLVLNLLLAAGDNLEDPDPAKHEETPLLAAIGRGHIRVIKLLLDQENFNPTRTTRDGKTYYELAEERHGPKWQKEHALLKEHYDAYMSKRKVASGGKKRKLAETGKSAEAVSRLLKDPISPKAIKHKRLITRKELPVKDSNSKRRSRPVLESSQSEGSDDEVRVAKKPMRARKESTAGKSTRSGPPSPVTNRHPPGSKFKSIPTPDLKGPKEARKVSGPRKSSGDKQALSDVETKDVKPIKQGTPEEVREARRAEEKAKAAEIAREKEEAARLKKEEEQRKLEEEAAAKEAERKAIEAAVKEAERKAEEERQRIEKERLEREERLNALPTALRVAVEKGPNRPLKFRGDELGISMQFLPINVFSLREIEANCDDERKDEQWMMSFQVVGILGLSSELHMTEFPDWEKRDVTTEQRELFLRNYHLTRLAQQFRWPEAGETGYDPQAIEQGLAATRQKFLTMEPLSFVKYSDFLEAVKKPEYEHLHGLKMRTSTCCRVSEDSECMGLDQLFADDDETSPSAEAN